MSKNSKKLSRGRSPLATRQEPVIPDATQEKLKEKPSSTRLVLLACILVVMVVAGVRWGVCNQMFGQSLEDIQIHQFGQADHRLALISWFNSRGGEVSFYRARVAWMRGDPHASNQHLVLAASQGFDLQKISDERFLILIKSGGASQSYAEIERLLQRHPADEPAILEAYVMGFLAEGNYAQANVVVEAWTQSFPQDGRPYYWRGIMYTSRAQDEEAKVEYRKALQLAPDMSRCRVALADLLSSSGLDRLAVEHYERSLKSDPDDLFANVALATSLLRLGKYKESSQRLDDLLKLHPQEMPVRRALAELADVQNDPQKVIEHAGYIHQKMPQDANANYLLASAFHATRNSKSSLQYFDAFQKSHHQREQAKALEETYRKNQNPGTAAKIASLYLESDWSQAVTWILIGLSSQPNRPDLNELMAKYLELSGDAAAAVAYRQKSQ